MSTPSAFIITLWIVVSLFWLISATGVKKAVHKAPFWQRAGVRVLLVIAAIRLTRSLRIRSPLLAYPSSPGLVVFGVGLCVAGLAFAVWARLHLGRNWGPPMSLREGHELVTTGPYRFVRHPIYSGVLLALLGSGLAAGPLWFLILALTFPFYIYSAWEEERVMMRQFPDAYPEYKRRTSALIPFVW